VAPGPRPLLSRALRLGAVGGAAPAVAGALLAALVLAGEPVDGRWQWTVRLLLLAPVVLVHSHRRGDRLGLLEGAAVSAVAGLLAYAVAATGLLAGAAAALAVAVAVQTGALPVAVQLGSLVTAALTVRAAVRRPA
jgi:hypothetical protein